VKGRTIVRRFNIGTPFRRMVKSTRYRKPRYTARTLLNAPVLRDATLREVKTVVKRECERLCKKEPSPSYLRSGSVQSLKEFEWKEVISELCEKAPVLISILETAAKASQARPSQVTMIAMAAAILLKARSKMMCKVQMLVASLLYAGHAAKRVSASYMQMYIEAACTCTYAVNHVN